MLKTAIYNHYRNGSWYASRARFQKAPPTLESSDRVVSTNSSVRSVDISAVFHQKTAMLPLPAGAVSVSGFPLSGLRSNRFGTVVVENPPETAIYDVRYGKEEILASPPDEEDLYVGREAAEAVAHTAGFLKLKEMDSASALSALKRHFADRFSYSLSGLPQGASALADFLMGGRSGHCELFATAAALTLRHAGIPARYVSGYSVSEFSRLERCFVVRDRHSHAWVSAWIKGQWVDFDPTPPSWVSMEEDLQPFWTPASDFFSWLGHRLRTGGTDVAPSRLLWLTVPAGLIWLCRSAFGKRFRQLFGKRKTRSKPRAKTSGEPSLFDAVEQRLARMGFVRPPQETPRAFLRRIGRVLPEIERELHPIVEFHYRLRFDADSLSAQEKKTFDRLCRRWLDKHAAPPNRT